MLERLYVAQTKFLENNPITENNLHKFNKTIFFSKYLKLKQVIICFNFF